MILDTNALSAFIDGDRSLGRRLAGLGQVSIPAIVLGEFRYSIAGSRHRAAYETWLDEHLPNFDVLGVGPATANVLRSGEVPTSALDAAAASEAGVSSSGTSGLKLGGTGGTVRPGAVLSAGLLVAGSMVLAPTGWLRYFGQALLALGVLGSLAVGFGAWRASRE